MKLLIDAQLPYLLCEILEDLGFDAVHVRIKRTETKLRMNK